MKSTSGRCRRRDPVLLLLLLLALLLLALGLRANSASAAASQSARTLSAFAFNLALHFQLDSIHGTSFLLSQLKRMHRPMRTASDFLSILLQSIAMFNAECCGQTEKVHNSPNPPSRNLPLVCSFGETSALARSRLITIPFASGFYWSCPFGKTAFLMTLAWRPAALGRRGAPGRVGFDRDASVASAFG